MKDAFFYPDSAWCTPFVGGSYKFETNGVRNLDAYSMFFFYATGITPAMTDEWSEEGSQYAAAFVDGKGNPLDGSKSYKCTCQPTFRQRISGQLSFTIIRHAPCSKPINNFQPSAARPRGWLINRRPFGGYLFRAEGPGRQGKQLGADRPRQGLEYASAPLRSAGAVVHKSWRPGEIEPM